MPQSRTAQANDDALESIARPPAGFDFLMCWVYWFLSNKRWEDDEINNGKTLALADYLWGGHKLTVGLI